MYFSKPTFINKHPDPQSIRRAPCWPRDTEVATVENADRDQVASDLGGHGGLKWDLRLEKQVTPFLSWRTHDVPTGDGELPGSFFSSIHAPNEAHCLPITAAILGGTDY